MMRIESRHNARIKEALQLFKKSVRDETDLFIIEGYRELLRASENGVAFQTLFFCREHFLKDNEDALIQKIKAGGALILDCAKTVFEKLSYRDRPDGLFAIARQKHFFREHLVEILQNNPAPFFVVVERIEKPGNLGTILRTADGVDADAVIVCDPVVDIYNPNVVRASVGTLFSNVVVKMTGDECLSFLKENRVKTVATSPKGGKYYFEADLSGKIAIAFGAEQYGLTTDFLNSSDEIVRIPMTGAADSLNVSAAAAIMLYEAFRQRYHAPD
ncbi:MAG: RNA methyltransferase [PVC group bacterium]